ncbi:MAG TPA: autotransporter-associated beta strand repeat-containing protein [Tepidisphaeraceae bacterium]|nr:autotransporter-associated beta strand repeat-containing protein [Tepidisphaeraceae bacterium]
MGVVVSILCASLRAQTFTGGITSGTIANSAITEASGIAASRLNPNVLWTHNDSFNPARIFAFSSTGATLGSYTLTGATNVDWEDIAVGPGPILNTQYVYVGDIGDNGAARGSIAVYRLPEPTVSDIQSAVTTSLSGASKFTLAYPTANDPAGNPQGAQDAESLFVDPISKDVYIVTKRLAVKHVYKATLPATPTGTMTLSLVSTLNMSDWVTSADISVDGNNIAIRGGSFALLYVRPPGGSVADAFATTPISIPLLSEGQGEAIGFDSLGQGYYTTSEGASAPIHYFGRIPMTLYWDQDGAAAGSYAQTGAGMGGTGSWDSTAKWYNPGGAEMAYTSGSNAVFWGTAGTVTLLAAQNVNSMAFKTSGYTITGSTLTLGGPTITVDSGVTATISSIVAGSSGLVKNGPGTLKLAKGNTYSGGTTINAGTLGIISNALGAIPTSNAINITINNGSALRFDVNNLTLAATRQVLLGSGGGIIDTNGNNDTIAGLVTGSGSLTKTGAGSLTLTATNNYTGATNVLAGKLLIGATLTTSSGMNVSNGAIAEILAGASNLLRTGTFNTNISGKIDLNNNQAILDYGGSSPIDNIRAMMKTGYNNGSWDGNGIMSTSAAATSASGMRTSIAYAEATSLFSSFPSTFANQTIDSTTLLLVYTIAGDADMNGMVNILDFNRLATAFGTSGTWVKGDFNYDGTVDILDFNTLAMNFGKSITVSFAIPAGLRISAESSAAVPLPPAIASGGLLLLGLIVARLRL